jgi:hypothetical protein
MALLDSCQYTAVSKGCTLEATYCPFDSHRRYVIHVICMNSTHYNVKPSYRNDRDIAFKTVAQWQAMCVASNFAAISPSDIYRLSLRRRYIYNSGLLYRPLCVQRVTLYGRDKALVQHFRRVLRRSFGAENLNYVFQSSLFPGYDAFTLMSLCTIMIDWMALHADQDDVEMYSWDISRRGYKTPAHD